MLQGLTTNQALTEEQLLRRQLRAVPRFRELSNADLGALLAVRKESVRKFTELPGVGQAPPRLAR